MFTVINIFITVTILCKFFFNQYAMSPPIIGIRRINIVIGVIDSFSLVTHKGIYTMDISHCYLPNTDSFRVSPFVWVTLKLCGIRHLCDRVYLKWEPRRWIIPSL